MKTSVAGLLMEKELSYLGMALEAPERPFVAVLGGAKVSDKIEVIESLLPRVDALLIGGGMAYTFFRPRASPPARAWSRRTRSPWPRSLLDEGRGQDPAARRPRRGLGLQGRRRAPRRCPVSEIPEGWMGLDIGPQTADGLRRARRGAAKIVLWNGPMGVFEMEPFAEGTLAMARALADSAGTTIVGGGDSVAAVTQMGLADKIDHVSTGGGASLEFLAGDRCPGVACLQDA